MYVFSLFPHDFFENSASVCRPCILRVNSLGQAERNISVVYHVTFLLLVGVAWNADVWRISENAARGTLVEVDKTIDIYRNAFSFHGDMTRIHWCNWHIFNRNEIRWKSRGASLSPASTTPSTKRLWTKMWKCIWRNIWLMFCWTWRYDIRVLRTSEYAGLWCVP